jgi:glutathione S-transferase
VVFTLGHGDGELRAADAQGSEPRRRCAMRLYFDPISPHSRPVTFLLYDQGIPFSETIVNLHLNEQLDEHLLSTNPLAQVPLLDDDGFLLAESTAILKYVARKHELAVYPTELQAQARVDAMLAWSCRLSAQGSAAELGRLNELLERQHHAAGDELSLADYAATSWVTLSEYVAFDLSPYPSVVTWLETMKARPGYDAAFAGFHGLVTAARREHRGAELPTRGRVTARSSLRPSTVKGIETMIKVIVRHKVENFERWYEAYKSFRALRDRYHVRADSVFRVLDDPTEVTVTHDFERPEHVKAILESEEIRTALGQAGVVGEPTVWMLSPVA